MLNFFLNFVPQISKSPIFVPGVWGPYFSAMVPDLWLNEGGQSATGKLVRMILKSIVKEPCEGIFFVFWGHKKH